MLLWSENGFGGRLIPSDFSLCAKNLSANRREKPLVLSAVGMRLPLAD
jgi:hypothetical protein